MFLHNGPLNFDKITSVFNKCSRKLSLERRPDLKNLLVNGSVVRVLVNDIIDIDWNFHTILLKLASNKLRFHRH